MMFTNKQLISKDFLKEQEGLYEKIEMYDEFLNAYRLSKSLEESINKIPGFKNKHYDLYDRYKEIIIKLKWIGLQVMTSDKIVNIFQYHFMDTFNIFDYDLWKKFEASLLGFLYIEDRDVLKRRVIKALEKNEQKITSKKIVVSKDNKRPTIGNWIKDYSINLGIDKTDDIKRIEYLTNGTNIRELSPDELERVKTLFELYEKLKLSSQTMEGFEEAIPMVQGGKPGTLYRGVFTPYSQDVIEKLKDINQKKKEGEIIVSPKKVEKIQELSQESEVVEDDEIDILMRDMSKYPTDSLEFKALQEEIKRLEQMNK